MLQITDVDDLITKIRHLTLDGHTYYTHLKTNTLDTYYRTLLQTIIFDFTNIPVTRNVVGLDPIEDAKYIEHSFHIIADIVSSVFDKSQEEVEKDLLQAIDKFPTDDARLAHYYRLTNNLH